MRIKFAVSDNHYEIGCPVYVAKKAILMVDAVYIWRLFTKGLVGYFLIAEDPLHP